MRESKGKVSGKKSEKEAEEKGERLAPRSDWSKSTTTVSPGPQWVTVHKPKAKLSTSLTAIAGAKKETVRTPKDPDRSVGFGTLDIG